jgi:hypothetical protein
VHSLALLASGWCGVHYIMSSPLSSGMRPIRRSSLFSNLGKPATPDTPFPPRYRPYSREPRGGGPPTSRMREAGGVSHPGREEAAGRSFHFLNCLGFESGLKIWREKRVGVVAERIQSLLPRQPNPARRCLIPPHAPLSPLQRTLPSAIRIEGSCRAFPPRRCTARVCTTATPRR